MIFLKQVNKLDAKSKSYPFSVPTISSFDTVHFNCPITFLMGENGSGKSTFIESLAVAANLHVIGGKPLHQDSTLDSIRPLAENLKLYWTNKSHRGFFIRSEDVFGFTQYLETQKDELKKDAKYFDKTLVGYGRQLAVGAALGQKNAFESRYGKNLDANSHGETFLRVFQSRFVPNGLYLLDEPETPLSFKNQLALLIMIKNMVTQGAQFIIATHSPILTAEKEAEIYSFDEGHIHKIKYQEIESFQLMKDFLNHPEAFLNHLL